MLSFCILHTLHCAIIFLSLKPTSMLTPLHHSKLPQVNFDFPFKSNSLRQCRLICFKFCLVILSSLFAILCQAQPSISVTGVSPSPVCQGSNVTITFSTTNGTGTNNHYKNATTSYTVFLSNSTGTSFT